MKIRKAILIFVLGYCLFKNSIECMVIISLKMQEGITYINEREKNIQYTKEVLYYVVDLAFDAVDEVENEDYESAYEKLETAEKFIELCTCIIYENNLQDEDLKELYINSAYLVSSIQNDIAKAE